MKPRNSYQLHQQNLSKSDKIAIFLTDHAGTMYFFYFCVCLSFIPLILPQSLSMVQFISSGFLQLVFLPLIVLTQNLQNRHTELRAEHEYLLNLKEVKANQEILKLLREIKEYAGKR